MSKKTTDFLFEEAYKLSQANIYNKLNPGGNIIAVEAEDGEIYYMIIGNEDNSVNSVILCNSDEIINHLQLNHCRNQIELNPHLLLELRLNLPGITILMFDSRQKFEEYSTEIDDFRRKYLKYSKKGFYPTVERHRGLYTSIEINDQEEKALLEALIAINDFLAVPEQIHTDEIEYDGEYFTLLQFNGDYYEATGVVDCPDISDNFRPVAMNMFALKNITKLPSKGTIALDIVLCPEQSGMGKNKHYKYTVLVKDYDKQKEIKRFYVNDYKKDAQKILSQLGDELLIAQIRPEKIYVQNERDFNFFENFAKTIDAQIEIVQDTYLYESIEDYMWETSPFKFNLIYNYDYPRASVIDSAVVNYAGKLDKYSKAPDEVIQALEEVSRMNKRKISKLTFLQVMALISFAHHDSVPNALRNRALNKLNFYLKNNISIKVTEVDENGNKL